jgi:hypothetical protein
VDDVEAVLVVQLSQQSIGAVTEGADLGKAPTLLLKYS